MSEIPLSGPDCTRCGAPAAEHMPAGKCPRPPLSVTEQAAGRWEQRRTGNRPASNGHPGLVGALAALAAVAAVVWVLSANASANCSTLAQLGGATCYPIAVELHQVSGWGALLAAAGAVLAAVTGRK